MCKAGYIDVGTAVSSQSLVREENIHGDLTPPHLYEHEAILNNEGEGYQGYEVPHYEPDYKPLAVYAPTFKTYVSSNGFQIIPLSRLLTLPKSVAILASVIIFILRMHL